MVSSESVVRLIWCLRCHGSPDFRSTVHTSPPRFWACDVASPGNNEGLQDCRILHLHETPIVWSALLAHCQQEEADAAERDEGTEGANITLGMEHRIRTTGSGV